MKTRWILAVLAGLGIVPLVARADGPGCCAPACCAPPPINVSMTLVPEKYTVCVPCKSEIKAVARPMEVDKVRCRTVPVCVTDPCTGCTRTECKTETYVERVKATVIDFHIEEVPAKTEQKTRYTFIINLSQPCATPCPAPCGGCP